MLKLTTDRHEASRGLSAIVELLVLIVFGNVANYLLLSRHDFVAVMRHINMQLRLVTKPN